MLTVINAREWERVQPDGTGEKRSLLMEIEGEAGVEIEVRCGHPVELNAISDTGHSVFLAWGQHCKFAGKLIGFRAVEVVTDQPFCIRSAVKNKWFEKPDPKRVTVLVDNPADKPVEDLIREALLKQLTALRLDGMFKDDAEVEELIDDLQNGDLDFEEEPDPFGLGAIEEPDDEEEPELPLGEPGAPPAPPAGPSGPAPAPASGTPPVPPAAVST